MKKRQFFIGLTLAAVIGAGTSLGVYKLVGKQDSGKANSIEQLQNKAGYQFVKSNTMVPSGLDFTQAAEVSTPGVVHIKIYKSAQVSAYGSQDPFDDFFKQFFGDQYQHQSPHQNAPGESQPAGAGSGVILTSDGYIATNNHVINGADKIEVTLNDRRRYEATLVGTDPTTDLALLKIEESELNFIKYGNSDDVKVGQWVLAVGNPFDLTSTVTAGIVSAKARNINILRGKSNYAIESFIQTDAAVNPGNSGGALVDLNGDLVGINTAIATPTGTYAGYSFAVPVSLVQKVMNDLLNYGEVQRALLGVSIRDVDAQLAEELDLDDVEGVYIAGVREDGSAHAAGVEEGDVIKAINGSKVNSSSKLQEVVATHRPGDEIEVTINRNGKTKVLKAVLKNKLGTTNIVNSEEATLIPVLGAHMVKASANELSKLGIDNGVKITKLEEGVLRNGGIKQGFVINKVAQKRVHSPGDVAALIENASGPVIVEGVYLNGKRAYYAIGW